MCDKLRNLGLVSSIAIFMLILAACAPAAPSPTAAPAKPAATTAPAPAAPKPTEAAAKPAAPAATTAPAATWTLPTGPVTLTFWDTADAPKNKFYQEVMFPAWQKQRPNVTLKYETISTADMLQKLLVALSTGTGPDMFVLTDWFMPTYFAKNLLDPLPPEAFGYNSLQQFVDSYMPGRLDVLMNNGKLYAMPYLMTQLSFFINNAKFKEAALDPVKDGPKTWDDVAKLNQKLTKKQGDRIVQKGYEMRYAGDHWMMFMFSSLIRQAGGEVLTADGKPAFNNDAGVKALNVWKSVSVAPKVTKNTGASPWQDFADQQDVMAFMGPNGGKFTEALNPAMKNNYTAIRMPQIDPAKTPLTTSYVFSVVVNPKAPDDRKKVAWDLVREIRNHPQELWDTAGYITALKSWYESPTAKQIPFMDVFLADLGASKALPRSDHFNELQSTIARAIERVVYDNVDPKKSLDQAADEFTRALR